MHQRNSTKSRMPGNSSTDSLRGNREVLQPLDEREVADRAYFRWIERGRPENSAEEDWFEAERELRLVNVASAGRK